MTTKARRVLRAEMYAMWESRPTPRKEREAMKRWCRKFKA